MNLVKNDLASATAQGIITTEQAKKLWEYLESLRPDQGHFQGLHVLYYFGGILVLASMSWFLNSAWKMGWAVMLISGLFAIVYLIVGLRLWRTENFKIPGGLLVTAAVGLTPVFIYGFQRTTGLWPQGDPGAYRNYHVWVKGSWFFMEFGTILAAALALRNISFPFITFPLAFSLWYMSMDLTPLIFGKSDFSFDERNSVSCLFGAVVLLASFFLDRKYPKKDFAFWTYLYGMLSFWGGLSLMKSNSELSKFIYCLLNLSFFVLGVYLRRRVFLVFGSLGVIGYLSHLAWTVFRDSFGFPFVLAFLGIGMLFLGVQYQKRRSEIEASMENMFPTFLLKWRPQERA